jgi:hypothetical protein
MSSPIFQCARYSPCSPIKVTSNYFTIMFVADLLAHNLWLNGYWEHVHSWIPNCHFNHLLWVTQNCSVQDIPPCSPIKVTSNYFTIMFVADLLAQNLWLDGYWEHVHSWIWNYHFNNLWVTQICTVQDIHPVHQLKCPAITSQSCL